MGREEGRGLVVAVELDLDHRKAKHNFAKRPRSSIPSNTEEVAPLGISSTWSRKTAILSSVEGRKAGQAGDR